MVRLGYMFLAGAAVMALAGCGTGTAATPQVTRSALFASLAPKTGSANPVRIPDAPKSPAAKSTADTEIAKAGPNASQNPPAKQDNRSNDNRASKDYRKDATRYPRNEKGGNFDFFRSSRRGNAGSKTDGKTESITVRTTAPANEQGGKVGKSSADGENVDVTPTTFPSTSSFPAPKDSTPGNTNMGPFSVKYGTGSSARSFKKVSAPSGVPSWFTDNDEDGDAQLMMNEWPKERIDEFRTYDRNRDGIITAEEALRTVSKGTTVAAGSSSTTTPSTTPTTAPPTPTAAPASSSSTSSSTVTMSMSPGRQPGTPLSDDDAKRRADFTLQWADENKDNILDTREINERGRNIRNLEWKKYDANKDEKLDKTELTAFFKAEGNNMRGGGGGPGGGGFGGGGGGGGMNFGDPDAMARTMFNNADKKKAGKLTREEFPSWMANRFEEFDKNKDSAVDFEEFKAGFANMRASMGGGGRNRGGEGDRGRGGEGRGGEGGRRGFEGGGRGGFEGGEGGGRRGNGGGFEGMGRRGGGFGQ